MSDGDNVSTPESKPLESGHVPINGINMYYEVHGRQDGVPLVLLHGGGSTIEVTFGNVLPVLAGRRRVIALEEQAHGRTTDRNAPVGFESSADDVAALLRYLKVDQADVFGFSNGASTTLEIAIRHPELVNKIIVASTMYKKEGAYPWFWDMMAHPTFEGMPQPLKDAYLHINPDTNALYAMYKRDVARMQSFKDIKEEDIKAIKAPSLIICGDHDVVRPEHAIEMYRQMQHAKLMILPGGHGEYMGEITTVKPGHNEYPVVSIIETFLNDVTK